MGRGGDGSVSLLWSVGLVLVCVNDKLCVCAWLGVACVPFARAHPPRLVSARVLMWVWFVRFEIQMFAFCNLICVFCCVGRIRGAFGGPWPALSPDGPSVCLLWGVVGLAAVVCRE